MSRILTQVVEDDTQIDLKIGGDSMLQLTSDGISRPNGKNADWYQDIVGGNIAVGGAGAAAATVTVGSRVYNAWALPNDATLNAYLEINFWLPPDYDGSALKFCAYMTKTATATGTDIDTRIRVGCIGAGDNLSPTLSAAVDVVDTVGTNETLFLVEHTLTPANAADGGLCHGIIQRVASLPADDYTGTVYLIGARVEYA